MTLRLVDKAGGWRSLASGSIIVSFLALAGLLAITGHSMHQFLAVAYLLVAAFVVIHVFPRQPDRHQDPDAGAGFEANGAPGDQPCGCHCDHGEGKR